jgi:predicted transcriptional regulator
LFRAIDSLPDGEGDLAAVAAALDITEPMALPLIERERDAGYVSDSDGVYALTMEGEAMVPAPDDSGAGS